MLEALYGPAVLALMGGFYMLTVEVLYLLFKKIGIDKEWA